MQVSIPIRVRGMSVATKFFDEETATTWLSKYGLMTRIRNLVELETEVHVLNLENSVGGNFRVAWVNTRPIDGFYDIGLELNETEGDLWGIHFPPGDLPPDEAIAPVWLECKRCHQHKLAPVPEAEFEYLREGFMIARPCDHCKSTTPWEFAVEAEIVVESGAGKAAKQSANDLRGKGRAVVKMKIKVIRRVLGMPVEEVCVTDNVSRHGVYFFSSQPYQVGEPIAVVMPYKEGDVAIPVPASVVRTDKKRSTSQHGIAVQLQKK